MQTTAHHPHLHYHAWKDVGGPVGLILDVAFFVFVLASASLMLAFCTTLACLNYVFTEVPGFVRRTWKKLVS